MPNKFLKSPLSGYGSKSEACRIFKLHEFFPILTDYKQIYIEPFCFTASVFWNIQCKSAILNDIEGEIMNFWEVMLHKRQELNEKILPIWIGDEWYNQLNQIINETNDPVYRAIRFYMCNRNSVYGIPTTQFKYSLVHKTFEKDFSQWQSIIDQKYSFATWNLDYRQFYEDHILTQHGEKDGRIKFYIYADPPYIEQGKNYLHNFTPDDHLQLAKYHNILKDNPDFFIIISYDDHPTIRELYKNWHIQQVSWKTGAKARKMNEYSELMISNRPFKRYTSQTNLSNLLKKEE